MNRKAVIVLSILAVLVVGCVVGVFLLLTSSGSEPEKPTETTFPITNPENPNPPTDPGTPSQPSVPTQPEIPTDPSKPEEPTLPDDPQDPSVPEVPDQPDVPEVPDQPDVPEVPDQPDQPEENPNQCWKAEIFVTREDGSIACGAAVIATDSRGRQEYEPTDERGKATLELPRGVYSLQVFLDGQRATAELQIDGEDVETTVQLQDQRTLYILLNVTGEYDCAKEELAGYSVLVEGIKAKYPDAVYLTSESRYDEAIYDGDALLTVEAFVEYFIAPDQYYLSEVWANLTTFQTCITVWDTDDGSEELEIEFADGNTSSIRIRNDYEYGYKDSMTVISESYYQVKRDWHFSQYTGRADQWSYGYTMETVASTASERKVKTLGAGMKAESFWFELNETRYQDYLGYVQELFSFVDLWMSGNWNEEIRELTMNQK